MKEKIKVIFAGTGNFGEPILEELISDERFAVSAVISGGKNLISKTGEHHKVPTFNPTTTKEMDAILSEHKPDILLVVAYGKILKNSTLELPKVASINIHGSILPKYRGASPIHAAVLNGDKETGVSWVIMEEKLDAGPVIATVPAKVEADDTFTSLYKKLSQLSAEATPDILASYYKDRRTTPQVEVHATYAGIIKKEDGELKFEDSTAAELVNKVRAYDEWPGTHFFHNGKRIKVLKAHAEDAVNSEEKVTMLRFKTKKGLFVPDMLQPESKKPMSAVEFYRGYVRI